MELSLVKSNNGYGVALDGNLGNICAITILGKLISIHVKLISFSCYITNSLYILERYSLARKEKQHDWNINFIQATFGLPRIYKKNF